MENSLGSAVGGERCAHSMPEWTEIQVWHAGGPRRAKMCRNIKTLFNFQPPATEDEIQASAVQFVRKLSGFNKSSQANAEAFERAVAEVSDSARRLLASLETNAP